MHSTNSDAPPLFHYDYTPGGIPGEYIDEKNISKDLNAQEKKNILDDFRKEYEVPYYMNKYSSRLTGKEIIFIVDDSGSMGCKLNDYSIPEKDANKIMKNTRISYIRRWDELRYYITLAMKLALAFDEDGIDILLLNRKEGYYKSVNNENKVDEIFNIEPKGSTPLYEKTQKIFNEHKSGTNKVIIIATDGELSDRSKEDYKKLIKNRSGKNPKELPIVFMICSDQDSDVEYLNEMDDLPDVGVVDDYNNEKKQILNREKKKQYTNGAHIFNIILNWVPEIDRIDETASNTPASNTPASNTPAYNTRVNSARRYPKTPRPKRTKNQKMKKTGECCVIL